MRRLAGIFGLILLAAACLALAAGLRAPEAQTLQLRVIGASNSVQAQTVKLGVRDAVLAEIAPGLCHQRSAAAAAAYLREELPAIRQAALAVTGPAGESVRVQLGVEPVPAHRMGLVNFPARRAPALLVTLGAGRGHNWWTVLFPPLALVTIDHHLMVVGPSGGAAVPVHHLAPADRSALLAAVSASSGHRLPIDVQAAGTGGWLGTDVQVRFAIWDAVRRMPWHALDQRVLGWLARA